MQFNLCRHNRSLQKRSLIFSKLLLFFLTLGVPTFAQAQNDAPVSEQDYADLAASMFYKAEQAFQDENWATARQYYTYVRNRFPYSRFAALSELRVGDVYFEQDQYATAIQQYRGFIRLYPHHEKTTYAAYKTALAFYKAIPQDTWPIFPPAYEIDIPKVTLAEREIQYFLKKYPNSKYEKDARQILRRVQRRLADHEFYVATFYMKRDNYRAGALRLKYLLTNYPGVGLDDKALFLLARCNIELKDMNAAFNALADLVEYHPESPYFGDAKRYLEKYRK